MPKTENTIPYYAFVIHNDGQSFFYTFKYYNIPERANQIFAWATCITDNIEEFITITKQHLPYTTPDIPTLRKFINRRFSIQCNTSSI